MARGIQGLINQSYYDNVASAFGFTAPSSSSQSLATANYRPSVYAQSSTANLQMALAVASAVPLIGSVASLASAGLAIAEGDAVGAVLGVAGAIPGVGSAKAAVRGADLLLDAARVEGAAAKYSVGAYNEIRGAVAGMDAHHVGQQALMKELIPGYDASTAPAILVPKVGHTIKGPNGIVSRSTNGLTTQRDVLARDISELRRVYSDIPNGQLQELIRMNKNAYPSAFSK